MADVARHISRKTTGAISDDRKLGSIKQCMENKEGSQEMILSTKV